jgi:hypothetical protein
MSTREPAEVHPLFRAAQDSLTLREVAALFQVSTNTVHLWRRPPGVRGCVLPSFVLAGRRLFRRADVARFVDELQAVGHGRAMPTGDRVANFATAGGDCGQTGARTPTTE